MLADTVLYSPTVDSQLTIHGRPEIDIQFISHSRALALQESLTRTEQVQHPTPKGHHAISHW